MPAMTATTKDLEQAWRLLLQQWQATSALWADAAQSRFQRTYMDDYEPVVSAAMAELQRLDQVIAQARRAVK